MTLKKKLIGLFVLLLLIAGGGYSFYMLPSAPTLPPASPATQATSILQQSTLLKNAFKRMLSLGYRAEDIRYNSGQQRDIVGAAGILDAPLVPPANALAVPKAAWALGGGQIIGAFDADATDIAFYLSGLTQAACQALNTAIFQDAATTPPAVSGVSLAQWQQRQANILQLFQGKDRDSDCVESSEKDYVYYVVVLGSRVD